MFFKTTWDDPNETFDLEVKSGFINRLPSNETIHVIKLILDAVQSNVGQRLFEGMSRISISENSLELTFRFSSNAHHIAKVEAQIERQELHNHRVNFVFFVFARVDEVYKLDDSLPIGFQQNLDMPTYIK